MAVDGHRPELESPPARVEAVAARDPRRRALWWRGAWIDYGSLHERVRLLGSQLLEHVAKPGDRVAVVGDAEPDLVAAVLAAWSRRISIVPLSSHLSDRERQAALRVLGASVLLDAREEPARYVRLPVTSPVAAHPDEQLVIMTSGSSGTPKGVRVSRSRRWDLTRTIVRAYQLTADDVLLPTVPLVHSSGMVFTLATLTAGASLVLTTDRSRATLTRLVQTHGVTMVLGVPTTLERLCTETGPPHAPRLRTIVSMGSASSQALRQRLRQTYASSELIEYYGCTEHPHVTWSRTVDRCPPACVGEPFERVEVRVVDRAGNPVAPGEVGIVELRGPFLMLGYLTDEAGEWFRTGDLGLLDDDGHLQLAGRADHVIITAGLNVHPGEVEHILLEHPQVRGALVYPQPDPAFGARIAAAVTLSDNHAPGTVETLQSWCEQRLARHKRPTVIHVLDDLPKGPTGKVLRGDRLREAVEQRAGAETRGDARGSAGTGPGTAG